MKGLEPFVATILLVLIAVGIAAAFVNWQNWFLPKYADQATAQGQSQLNCLRAGIVLESISYNCSSNCFPGVSHTLRARILNTGDVPLRLYKISLQNTAGTVFDYQLGSTLQPDQTLDVTNVSTASCSGINRSVSRVYIATACSNVPGPFDGSAITWINC